MEVVAFLSHHVAQAFEWSNIYSHSDMHTVYVLGVYMYVHLYTQPVVLNHTHSADSVGAVCRLHTAHYLRDSIQQ